MVGPAVEVLTPAQTGKQQGARNLILPVLVGVAAQHGLQVLGGSLGVAQVELDQLPFFEHLAYGQAAGVRVRPHHVSDEEVALDGVFDQFVHHHSQEKGVPQQFAVPFRQFLKHAPNDFHRRFAIQFQQHVAVALGDAHGLADGTAALGHHRVHGDVAAEGQADGPGAQHLPVQEQRVPSLPAGAAGQAADLGGPGKGEVHPHQQVLDRERVGVGHHDKLRVTVCLHSDESFPFVGAGIQVGKPVRLKMEGLNVHVGENGGGYRDASPLLDLKAVANHAAARAAKHMPGAQIFGHQFGHPLVGILVMRRYESDRQVERYVPEGGFYGCGALGDGVV